MKKIIFIIFAVIFSFFVFHYTKASITEISKWAFVDGNKAYGINKDSTKSTDHPQLTVFNKKLYAPPEIFSGY